MNTTTRSGGHECIMHYYRNLISYQVSHRNISYILLSYVNYNKLCIRFHGNYACSNANRVISIPLTLFMLRYNESTIIFILYFNFNTYITYIYIIFNWKNIHDLLLSEQNII